MQEKNDHNTLENCEKHNNKAFQLPCIQADRLGSVAFKHDYGVKFSYVVGGMYRGIASKEMVIALAKAKLLGFFGTGGLSVEKVEENLIAIKASLNEEHAFGMNLVSQLQHPELELALVSLFLQHQVRIVEAAAFLKITEALVWYRVSGLYKTKSGYIKSRHKLLAKISRPEVATQFLAPAPASLVEKLLASGRITQQQAEFSQQVPMCDDICVEADSGGHTDKGQPSVLFPAIQALTKDICNRNQYTLTPRVGLAGGIGTPTAAASAFTMGADFILTGSINQCTVEAGTSELVKALLQDINVQDTDYAPAGDLFEFGSQVQVLKKGVLFPARANKLYQLYQQYDSLNALPKTQQAQLQEKIFKRTFDKVWQETKTYLEAQNRQQDIAKAERNDKAKMARVFRWYFAHSMKAAFSGQQNEKVDFQVHTGPALGAFNQWVKGSELAHWQNRYVVEIANKLMHETAQVLTQRLHQMCSSNITTGEGRL